MEWTLEQERAWLVAQWERWTLNLAAELSVRPVLQDAHNIARARLAVHTAYEGIGEIDFLLGAAS